MSWTERALWLSLVAAIIVVLGYRDSVIRDEARSGKLTLYLMFPFSRPKF